MGDGVAPRVAVKSHLDGDPKPRPDEVAEWDAMRVAHGLDTMLALIVLPNDKMTEGLFPGYETHWWEIRERDGEVTCEPTEVDVEVVPDA